jgi:hypothetical protein
MIQHGYVAEGVLERLGDLENFPDVSLTPTRSSLSPGKPTTSPLAVSSTARTRGQTKSEASSGDTSPTRSGIAGPTTDSKRLLTDCRAGVLIGAPAGVVLSCSSNLNRLSTTGPYQGSYNLP